LIRYLLVECKGGRDQKIKDMYVDTMRRFSRELLNVSKFYFEKDNCILSAELTKTYSFRLLRKVLTFTWKYSAMVWAGTVVKILRQHNVIMMDLKFSSNSW